MFLTSLCILMLLNTPFKAYSDDVIKGFHLFIFCQYDLMQPFFATLLLGLCKCWSPDSISLICRRTLRPNDELLFCRTYLGIKARITVPADDISNQTKIQIKSTNEVSEKIKFANFRDVRRYFKIIVLN